MKIADKIKRFSLLALLFSAFACASDDTETSTLDSSDIESTEISTRGMETRVQSKAFHYKNLAAFENGSSVLTLENLAELEGKSFNFVLLYDAGASWATVFNTGDYSQTGNETLNALMDSYQLEIVEQFEIDEENEGIVLEPIGTVEQPLEAARELSLVDDVLMVQIKEVPTAEESATTADNNQ